MSPEPEPKAPAPQNQAELAPSEQTTPVPGQPVVPTEPEVGGYAGPEPTRYGDWEHNGRCTDF